jgi:hypothetical protein
VGSSIDGRLVVLYWTTREWYNRVTANNNNNNNSASSEQDDMVLSEGFSNNGVDFS